ncbi:MAG TPA: NAD-dependent epimerase/dehydratase family protein [Candidatus Micrarchaeaceae archaeon]|nr:NAD-dependent epimerase/dehydratase family protein [Candidatus Micrarchaeaceae archaeon]
MRVVVTGAAGFIGSHLSEQMLAAGHEVVGVDCFADYYERSRKEQNLEKSRSHDRFRFEAADLVDVELAPLLDGADVVYHLAGQPGVRPSWGSQFDRYVRDNVIATQRLLEALKEVPIKRFVFAGSSSVYGDAERLPTKETALPRPVSPYGVTKLAAEHLTLLYFKNFGMPAVSVRYFTVYGPRQRPDMAFSRFMQAITAGEEIEVFGDGEQTREFTYVSDAVAGTIKASAADVAGQIFNLGGGSRVTVNQVLATLEEISGLTVRRRQLPAAPGDPRHTGASINLARERLGWEPRVPLAQGLAKQWEWFRAT